MHTENLEGKPDLTGLFKNSALIQSHSIGKSCAMHRELSPDSKMKGAGCEYLFDKHSLESNLS
jgi:hypothetical protein